MDKISVVVPIYNVEKYLKECIESIINQTYKNLEIILVNDGSTDNSLLIAENFSKQDERIKLYSKPNGGLSDARNFGIDKATGDYIGFVDSDDKIFPEMFSVLHKLIKKNDADISMVDFVRSNEKIKNNFLDTKVYGKEVFDKIMLDEICSHVWDKLFKKELFENIKFPVGMHFEDLAILYKITYKINKFVLSNQQLYWYRVDNVNSITQNKKNDNFNAKCIAKIYREKTNFSFEENLNIKYDVLKMAIKYNTDIYRVLRKEKNEHSELDLIKKFISVYYKNIMRYYKIDLLKKLFCFLIYHNIF